VRRAKTLPRTLPIADANGAVLAQTTQGEMEVPMLLPNNEYARKYIINETIVQFRHEAEVDRVLREIRPKQPHKKVEQIAGACHSLLHALAVLGRRLKIQPRSV
jgi:hypothetical protein